MLRIAVVGVGGISVAHIAAWEAIEDVKLVALCDVRPEMMEKYEGKSCYTDFDEMLEKEEIDILDICLPTYLHADFAIRAMEKGIHVLCEKPISLHQEDVQRVYGAAKQNNVRFMVAQVLRFWPEYELLKKFYDEETYGELLSGTMTRLGCYPAWAWDSWMMDEDRSGLVPFDLHIHDLDFMVYTFGKPNHFVNFRSKRPDQDYINVVYQYDKFSINTESSWYAAPYPFASTFRFQFEKALVVCENGVMTVYEQSGKIFEPISTSANDTGDIGLPASNAYENEIRYFVECVKTGVDAEKVKPSELETVIDILKAI